jgi:hypothetical protein
MIGNLLVEGENFLLEVLYLLVEIIGTVLKDYLH